MIILQWSVKGCKQFEELLGFFSGFSICKGIREILDLLGFVVLLVDQDQMSA